LIPDRDTDIDLSPNSQLLTLTSHPYIGRLEVSLSRGKKGGSENYSFTIGTEVDISILHPTPTHAFLVRCLTTVNICHDVFKFCIFGFENVSEDDVFNNSFTAEVAEKLH
jgi:hypothetical protein